MLTRRQFLRYSALVSAGVIAADQLEILDQLVPRSLFASADVPKPYAGYDEIWHTRGSVQILNHDIIVYANEYGEGDLVRGAPIAIVRNGQRMHYGEVLGITGNTVSVQWS